MSTRQKSQAAKPALPCPGRDAFPWQELVRYDRQWVAFDSTGTKIVANAPTLPELEERLAEAGEDASQVGLEWIEFDDAISVGGAELYS